MLILIRWLYQKPADLDLQCFKSDKSEFSRTGVNSPKKQYCQLGQVVSRIPLTSIPLRKNVGLMHVLRVALYVYEGLDEGLDGV